MVLNEPVESMSITSSGDDEEFDSCRVRYDATGSSSAGRRASEVGRLRSRLNASNGRAKDETSPFPPDDLACSISQ